MSFPSWTCFYLGGVGGLEGHVWFSGVWLVWGMPFIPLKEWHSSFTQELFFCNVNSAAAVPQIVFLIKVQFILKEHR